MTRAAWLIAASIWALVACAGVGIGAENETDIQVIDLGIAGAGPFGWLDNDTFVVMMNTGERYRRKDGAEVLVARVTTINYRTGERKTYGKVSSGFCFSPDGYASYFFLNRATDELWVSYGELGKETVRKIKRGEFNIDPLTCRPWNERPPMPSWGDEKTKFWRLWPALGLIDCRSASVSVREQYIKARFHRPDDEVGVELPFSCYEVFRGLQFYPFKGAYFSLEFDFRAPWPQSRDRRVFWLYPDGRVETIVLPYSSAVRESGIPTVRGIVAFAAPTKRGEDYWVYLVTPQSAKRILRGNASGVTSPDGCKVAMLHDPEFNARVDRKPVTTRVTLKVLELCEGR